jgi:lipid II:glycine glycyltransferase (peptidoglycan interpeptide bridge formation enzyme)
MSDEIFNFINTQFKQTGTAYWACTSCTAYAQGMNHRVKQLEEEMEEIRTACEKNNGGLQNVRHHVDKLSEKVEKISRQAAGAAASDETSVYEELREREQGKTNVVIYGMKEAPNSYAGMERWDWDKDSCGNLFRALKIDRERTISNS